MKSIVNEGAGEMVGGHLKNEKKKYEMRQSEQNLVKFEFQIINCRVVI
jgi:hypothetical protein